MGKSRNTYTVKGTKGNPQTSLSQENAELKARELAKKDVKKSAEKGIFTRLKNWIILNYNI